jgi:hypothetical protein
MSFGGLLTYVAWQRPVGWWGLARESHGCVTPMTGELIRASQTTAIRYERDLPGELVDVDAKKLGRIPPRGGRRAHGREMGSTAAKKKAPHRLRLRALHGR